MLIGENFGKKIQAKNLGESWFSPIDLERNGRFEILSQMKEEGAPIEIISPRVEQPQIQGKTSISTSSLDAKSVATLASNGALERKFSNSLIPIFTFNILKNLKNPALVAICSRWGIANHGNSKKRIDTINSKKS